MDKLTLLLQQFRCMSAGFIHIHVIDMGVMSCGIQVYTKSCKVYNFVFAFNHTISMNLFKTIIYFM